MIACVDLDGTLARIQTPGIGPANGPVLELVHRLLAEGTEVRIFTARMSGDNPNRTVGEVYEWLEEQGLPRLMVVNWKDYATRLIIDDIAIGVDDQGFPCSECMKRHGMAE